MPSCTFYLVFLVESQDEHAVALPLGWKVELARPVKRALLKAGPAKIGEETLALWEKLFDALEGSEKTVAEK